MEHCKYCGTLVYWDEARDGFESGWYSSQHYTNICSGNIGGSAHGGSGHDVA